ncbi:hypothetical protein PF007_g31559 [Phytophthora fragariae]|uniref:Uncharacterized protein n=1 Tax=Phytophthora fragariae TaxID=53985 RepID=A0A6A3D837_9STRA|nr:hypothetical protein PF009_g31986 [Phytophthora fragariae]KAE9057687.1 hypothetical protein PF007_g31559 [Phytophthora fragariae]KAE9266864.1 hypothetical protein PF008_g31508 [Phytophthora fragariae]
MSTPMPQHMLMLSHVPLASCELVTWLFTPMPKTIMTKVPRNSAKHSRMCTLCTAKRAKPVRLASGAKPVAALGVSGMLAYPFSALSARSSKGSGAALGDATSGVCVDGRGDMSTRSVAIPGRGDGLVVVVRLGPVAHLLTCLTSCW